MYIIKRKAQAQVISTILIILLVLAAIVIVWQVVQGTVKGGAEEIESQSQCIGLTIEITKIDTELGIITIRPNKDLSSYNVYVNSELIETDTNGVPVGEAVEAFTTSTLSIAVSSGDEIEVLGKVGETICPLGAKETAK
ncbi:MAG: hypothetical protein AABX77_03550 [Nanoarchaeota archaeon]